MNFWPGTTPPNIIIVASVATSLHMVFVERFSLDFSFPGLAGRVQTDTVDNGGACVSPEKNSKQTQSELMDGWHNFRR